MSAGKGEPGRGLRVLVVTLRYPPYVVGGYELLTRDAVEALRERGHQVSVLAGKGSQLEGLPDVYPWLEPGLDGDPDLYGRSFSGSNFERFGHHFYSRANARATERALEASGAELLFYFNLGLVSLAPIVAARRKGLPSLGYASDPWPLNHWLQAWKSAPDQSKKALRRRALGTLWRVFSKWVRFGALLTCSDYLREQLSHGRLPGAQLRTLHLGVPPDMEALAKDRPTPARAAGEVLRIACISSFWEGKGQEVLLGALELLHAEDVAFELSLAGSGSGPYLERLKQQAEGLGERVRFELDLGRAEVSELLSASHVLVVPSTWGEPFPLATLEGLAHGCALVVSSAGGSPEALEDGVEGLVVSAGDPRALAEALRRLAADEALRARLGAAGRARAQLALSHRVFMDGLEAAMYEQLKQPARR